MIGDWEDNPQRRVLLCNVFDACGVDLAAFNDAARHQRGVVGVLRIGQNHVTA